MGVKIPAVAKQYAGIFGMGMGVLVQQVLQRKKFLWIRFLVYEDFE